MSQQGYLQIIKTRKIDFVVQRSIYVCLLTFQCIALRVRTPCKVAFELRCFSAIRIIVKVAATFVLLFRFRGHGLKTFQDFPVSKGRLLHPLKLSGVSWPPQDIEPETASEIVLRLRYNSQERRKESSCFCTKIWSVIQELIYSEKATKI